MREEPSKLLRQQASAGTIMGVVREPTTCTKNVLVYRSLYVHVHNPQHTMIYIHANGNRFRQHECLTVSTKH